MAHLYFLMTNCTPYLRSIFLYLSVIYVQFCFILFPIQNDKTSTTTFYSKLQNETINNLPLRPKWLLIPRLIIGTAILKSKYDVSVHDTFVSE